MAKIQTELNTFHNVIKVEEEELVTSRDALMDKIKISVEKKGHPSPKLLNQGSYIYGVGIEPIGNLEHDIDVGLEFPISCEKYPDPKVIRSWVYDAIKDHTSNEPDQKNPCIRVYYQAGYHVDLVTYAKFKTEIERENDVENIQLGLKSGDWRPSEPKKLKTYIEEKRKIFDRTKIPGSADQLQRVVRYLKRWNDEAMPFESNDKPVGLALLLYCLEKLTPQTNAAGEIDDFQALKLVATSATNTIGRITAFKPTQEFEDVFGRISSQGMIDLKLRFQTLLEVLLDVERETDIELACKKMTRVFGSDFPITTNKLSNNFDKAESLKKVAHSITTPTKPWSY